MSSYPSKEIQRTPARGSTDPSPLSLSSPTQGVTTRSATGKALYRYVQDDGDTPTDSCWEHFIVLLEAPVTKLEGPVYGIIGEPVTTRSKGRKKQSQRDGVYVREIFHDSVGSDAYVVNRDNLEFVTKSRHEAHLDNLVFRTGRKVNYVGKIQYCQIVDTDSNVHGEPEGLIAINRGDEPELVNRYHVDSVDFKVCTLLEYILDYGSGEGKSKMKKVCQTGSLLDENILNETDLIGYQGKSKVNFTVSCDMGEELTYLSEEGEWKQTTPEEYLDSQVYDLVEEKPKPEIKKRAVKKEDIKVKIPKEKIKKVLFTETEVNSESEAEDPEDTPEVNDEIDSFTVTPSPPKVATVVGNKYGMLITGVRRERNSAIMNKSFSEGTWKNKTIEARAEKMYRMESKRGNYNNSRTAFQIWYFGNIGEDPLAYFMPYEKVPTTEVQSIPNGKWTISVEPEKWIKNMKQLSECIDVLCDIAHEYYRYDVYMAIAAIAKKAHTLNDMDLAMAGVNAYRDLYSGALAAIVDGAVDGFTGDVLLHIALGEVHPTSKAYSDIISDRLQRVSAGAQWGKTSSYSGGGGDGGGGKKSDAKKGDGNKGDGKSDGNKGKGMSDSQKDLVPSVDGRKVCLAFMSIRDCKRKDCLFLHDASPEVPEGLRNYFRKRFGAVKARQQ